MGLFETWHCVTRSSCLNPGDGLTIYTDGVIDALSDSGEEFGEERLLATLQQHRHLSASMILDAVVAAVQGFSGTIQEDDLTLIVVKAR